MYTDMVVPNVATYSTHNTDEFGPPFMILTYVYGTLAADSELSNGQLYGFGKKWRN